MRKIYEVFFFLLMMLQIASSILHAQQEPPSYEEILLPSLLSDLKVSVKDAISQIEIYPEGNFSFRPIKLEELSQLLWSAYNVKVEDVACCTPAYIFSSTASLVGTTPLPYCPIELYVILSTGVSLSQGIYKYNSQKHSLELLKVGDYHVELISIVGEKFDLLFSSASAFVIFSSIPENIRKKYGIRGEVKYTPLFIGKAIQNLHFQAFAFYLYVCPIVKFDEEKIISLLNLSERELPYCIASIVPLEMKEEKEITVEKEKEIIKPKSINRDKKIKEKK